MENQKNKSQFQIELKEEVAQGTYANLAIITHSSSEFIVDFVRVMPGLPKASVQSRVVLAPEHAKRLISLSDLFLFSLRAVYSCLSPQRISFLYLHFREFPPPYLGGHLHGSSA